MSAPPPKLKLSFD